jgi:hypothetical protein
MAGFIQKPFEFEGVKYCCIPEIHRTEIVPVTDMNYVTQIAFEISEGHWFLSYGVDPSGICCGISEVQINYIIEVAGLDENQYVDYYLAQTGVTKYTVEQDGVYNHSFVINGLELSEFIGPCNSSIGARAELYPMDGLVSARVQITTL